MNSIHEDDILQGDEYEMNGLKWKVAAFGEVIGEEHHYISSEGYNKKMKGEVSNESMRRLHPAQRHTVLLPDN